MSRHANAPAPTDKLLIDAFWQLFNDVPLEKITVKMISEKAGFNRTTFYEYFPDITTLIKKAEDELVKELQSIMIERLAPGLKNVDESVITKTIVEVFDLLGDKICALIGENGDPAFQDRLEKQLIPFMNRMIGRDFGVYSEYVATFANAAFVSVLRQWVKNKRNIEQDKLVSMLFLLIGKGTIGMDDFMRTL